MALDDRSEVKRPCTKSRNESRVFSWRLLNRGIPGIHKNSACVYSHARETCDVTGRSNDSQMHIFLNVPRQSVSHDLVRYNGSKNCSSTTGLLCSPPNLAFSLPLYFIFFLYPRFSFSSGCDLWSRRLAKGLSLGSVARSTNTKCACQEKERQTSTYNRWWKNGKGREDGFHAGRSAIIEVPRKAPQMLHRK